MSTKIFISETSLATDKTSEKLAIVGARNQKFNVELSWTGATGTLDGTVDLKYSTTPAATPSNNSSEQFLIDAASGTHQFFVDPYHLAFLQAVYTKNNITAIDIIVTCSDELAGA